MKILIDNGHGSNTAGKRSPDGLLREYKYARLIAKRVVEDLKGMGYDAEQLVTEELDIKLESRTKRANAVCTKLGAKNVLLVSIHCNAAPPNDNQWHKARGWCAYTSVGQTQGDKLADCLYEAAEEQLAGYASTFTEEDRRNKQRAIRTDVSDGDKDLEASFWILRKTACPAVLTENLFQDNRADVSYLLSLEGQRAITQLHVQGIVRYIERYGKGK